MTGHHRYVFPNGPISRLSTSNTSTAPSSDTGPRRCSASTSDRVLDLGCGWGTITFAMARHAREVVGIDFAPMAITLCNEELGRNGRPANATFRLADARDTGLEPGSFDVVAAADLFEHLYPGDSDTVAAEAPGSQAGRPLCGLDTLPVPHP